MKPLELGLGGPPARGRLRLGGLARRGRPTRKTSQPPVSASSSRRRSRPTWRPTARTPVSGSAWGSTAGVWQFARPRSGPEPCGRCSTPPPSAPPWRGSRGSDGLGARDARRGRRPPPRYSPCSGSRRRSTASSTSAAQTDGAAPTPISTAGPLCWTGASCAGSPGAGASCSGNGGKAERTVDRLGARRLGHHGRPAARGQGRHHRAQPALARLPRVRRVDRRHRPARRALVHRGKRRRRELGRRVLLLDPFGVVKAHRGRVPRVPPAGRGERHLQPAEVHTGGRGARGARHQRPARCAAHPAATGCAPEQSAFLRVRRVPSSRATWHGCSSRSRRRCKPLPPSTACCRCRRSNCRDSRKGCSSCRALRAGSPTSPSSVRPRWATRNAGPPSPPSPTSWPSSLTPSSQPTRRTRASIPWYSRTATPTSSWWRRRRPSST